MKQDVKEQWISALESGQHQQLICKFMDGYGNGCALGVLAMTVSPEIQSRGPYYRLGQLTSLTFRQMFTVMKWNDVERLTFPEIAIKVKEEL